MKRILVFVAALGLTACDADQVSRTLVGEADKAAAARKPTPTATRPATPETAGSPDAIVVVTTKSVPEYANDLEHCRAIVSSKMGPPGPDDDAEAIKRALKAHPESRIISLSYINEDLAIQRAQSVKQCMSKIGYLVR